MIYFCMLCTDPPSVLALTQREIVEGRDLSVTCQATPGNPSSTTFFWTKEDNSGFRQNGAKLHIPNIQRSGTGTYRCTVENNYSNGETGTHDQDMDVSVLCKNTDALNISTVIKVMLRNPRLKKRTAPAISQMVVSNKRKISN